MSSGLKINIVNPDNDEILTIQPYKGGMAAPKEEEWAQPILDKIGNALAIINDSQRNMIGNSPLMPYFVKKDGEITVTPHMPPHLKDNSILHLVGEGENLHPIIIMDNSFFNIETPQSYITNHIAHSFGRLLNVDKTELPSSSNPQKLHSSSPLFELALKLDVMLAHNNPIAQDMLEDINSDDKDSFIENAFNVSVAHRLTGDNVDTHPHTETAAPFDLTLTRSYIDSIVMTDVTFSNQTIPNQPVNKDYDEFINVLKDEFAGLGQEQYRRIEAILAKEPEIQNVDELTQARAEVQEVINGLKSKYLASAQGQGSGQAH